MAEGNELSEIFDTYPIVDMYSDIIADDFSSITFWLDIYHSEDEGDFDWCYVSAEFDYEGTPVNGFDVVADPMGDTCTFTGMNLAFKEEGDYGYILGPDGIWYQLYEEWEVEAAVYGEDYSYEEEYDYDYDSYICA